MATYVERDVRQLIAVRDLGQFHFVCIRLVDGIEQVVEEFQ